MAVHVADMGRNRAAAGHPHRHLQYPAHTPYAICLSKLTVYGPAERERLLARFAEQHGFGAGECCDLNKNAGEFRLTYRNYLESGAIWTIDVRGSSSGKRKYGFLTNCGEILTEHEYFDRYVI